MRPNTPDQGGARGRPRSADLLSHVQADLIGCQLVRRSPGTAVVTPPSGPTFAVEVHGERRRLIDLHVLAVHVQGPATEDIDAAIVLHHRGRVRRTGLVGRIRGRDGGAATALRDRLLIDGDLERASLPLDFTRFEVRGHLGAWRATLELMGASYVRTTFPPSARYVRLDEEQLAALLATVNVLHERLPGREPAPVTDASFDPARRPFDPARRPFDPAHRPFDPAHLPTSPSRSRD